MKFYLFVILLIGLFFNLNGQNNLPPKIANIKVTPDTVAKKVVFDFDVSDAENDTVEINLRVSANGGLTYNFPVKDLTGDVGKGIKPKIGNKIIWDYSKTDFSQVKTRDFLAKISADDKKFDVAKLVAGVDSVRMKNDLSFIAKEPRYRDPKSSHLDSCRKWIISKFNENGLTEISEESFVAEGDEGFNLMGKKSGALEDTAVYIIDGHYDSVKLGKGADDNGSGVAGLIEALRILSPYNFKKSIKFISFDLEEAGLLGSAAYCQEQIPDHEKNLGVLNMEMIGYYSEEPNSQVLPSGFDLIFKDATDSLKATQFRGNFITNVANEISRDLMKKFESNSKKFVPKLRVINLDMPFLIPDLMRSDHASFWVNNIPALMLTDGANFRNKNYHTEGDTMGTINYTFMSNVTKAVIATICDVAELMNADVKTTDVFQLNQPSGRNNILTNAVVEKFTAYPNPFEEEIEINFQLNQSGEISVDIYDYSGRQVRQLYHGKSNKNSYQFTWDGKDEKDHRVTNGMYFVRIQTPKAIFTKNILLQPHSHKH